MAVPNNLILVESGGERYSLVGKQVKIFNYAR